MKLIKTSFILLIAIGIFSSCRDYQNDVRIPSYIHLDHIRVVDTPNATLSPDQGFFSSEIDAIQIELWTDGADTTMRLGTYQLPCMIPVLSDNNITKMVIYPFVKQNGIAGTRIYYPYYQPITLTDITIKPDSITNIGTQQIIDGKMLWTLDAQYYGTPPMKVETQEFFEPGSYGLIFDTLMSRMVSDDNACDGQGYGVVEVPADKSELSFYISEQFEVTDPSKYLYLEIDYWSDVRLAVGMESAYNIGGNNVNQYELTMFDNEQWTKMYINLGGIWADFNHNPNFRIFFTALNPDKKDAKVRIDNVKLLTI